MYDNQCALLRKVATKYGMDGDTLIAEFLTDPLRVIPPSQKKIIVTQKHNLVQKQVDDEDSCRCVARTKSGLQCTKDARSGDNNQLCGAHARMLEEKGRLEFGTVKDGRSRCCARVWNRGNGGQCSRLATTNSDLCGCHKTELEKTGGLHHGRIEEPPPLNVFKRATKKKALYK